MQFIHCVFIGVALSVLTSCASKPAPTPELTEITVYNTGTFPMRPPQVCYYQEHDPKTCTAIEMSTEKLFAGQNYNFFIKANQKIRIVFPFDETHRASGVMYRPNCHILVDFYAYKEKRYHAEAQIQSQYSDPKKGFNCGVKVFEENLGSSQRIEMNDTLTSKIRYRVPQKGEVREGYISNYNWQ